MAYTFQSTSTQYISTASAPANGYPMTIAIWATVDSLTAGSSRMFVVSASNAHRHQLARFNSDIQAVSVGASGAAVATGNVAIGAAGTWFHHAGVFTSASDRRVFYNGSEVGANTTDPGAQNTFDRISIGAGGVPVGLAHSGSMAEAGVWAEALSADEIAALAKGVACRLIRPQSLVFYAPLIRDLIDARGGLAITNNNTATVSAHPRVYA